MGKILTYGMVGGGPDAFVGDAHRKAIALDGKAKIVAGCFSRNTEKTKKMADVLNLDISRCYDNYETMAKEEGKRSDKIDFVVIVTPNSSHYEICKAFIEAGINIVCEKPVTIEYSQAVELEELAKSKGLLFMVTYVYSGHVTAKYVRELINSGEIGVIRTVMAEYPQGWLAFEDNNGGKQGAWRCDPQLSGKTNCLGDLGTHIENTVAGMTGLKMKRVLAKMEVVVPGRELDDNDYVMLEFNNGATGVYWSSQFAIGCDNSLRIRIFGTKGTIEWVQENPEKVVIVNTEGVIREVHRGHSAIGASTIGANAVGLNAAKFVRLPPGHTEGWFEAMANLYCSYFESLHAKLDGTFTPDMITYPTVADGAEGVAFIEACLESSRNGNVWVAVESCN